MKLTPFAAFRFLGSLILAYLLVITLVDGAILSPLSHCGNWVCQGIFVYYFLTSSLIFWLIAGRLRHSNPKTSVRKSGRSS